MPAPVVPAPMPPMRYVKTDQGKAALLTRDALTLRERQIMVLCNGVRTLPELIDLFGRPASEIVEDLLARGLLEPRQPGGQRPAPVLPEPLGAATIPPPLDAAVQDAAVAVPPRRFVASQIDEGAARPPAPPARPMSLQELTALADVPPLRDDSASPDFDQPTLAPPDAHEPAPPQPAAPASASGGSGVASLVNSIDAEGGWQRSPVAAQAYMTQVLLALAATEALELVESSGGVQHDVDILLYLGQGLGQTHAAAGEDVALRVAMRVGRLLPESELPMLLDCAIDYVPRPFAMLLYEFVLAGRDASH